MLSYDLRPAFQLHTNIITMSTEVRDTVPQYTRLTLEAALRTHLGEFADKFPVNAWIDSLDFAKKSNSSGSEETKMLDAKPPTQIEPTQRLGAISPAPHPTMVRSDVIAFPGDAEFPLDGNVIADHVLSIGPRPTSSISPKPTKGPIQGVKNKKAETRKQKKKANGESGHGLEPLQTSSLESRMQDFAKELASGNDMTSEFGEACLHLCCSTCFTWWKVQFRSSIIPPSFVPGSRKQAVGARNCPTTCKTTEIATIKADDGFGGRLEYNFIPLGHEFKEVMSDALDMIGNDAEVIDWHGLVLYLGPESILASISYGARITIGFGKSDD
jgi:hypothetical protein